MQYYVLALVSSAHLEAPMMNAPPMSWLELAYVNHSSALLSAYKSCLVAVRVSKIGTWIAHHRSRFHDWLFSIDIGIGIVPRHHFSSSCRVVALKSNSCRLT